MQSSAASVDGTHPTRILIVDDHEVSRAALRALLCTEGMDVADVQTVHAVITATAFRQNVAIVDLTPGDPTGFRIAGQLQALPDAPAILLTSSADRHRFGPHLDRYRFLAKADLCARTITQFAVPPAPDGAGYAWRSSSFPGALKNASRIG
jgi:CheY-like chemotaxis protein